MRSRFLNRSAATALAAGLTALSGGAQAQTVPAAPNAAATQDEPTSEQDIVVTGFRRSLQLANEAKRSADVVSDGISAEDIGKFPDQNLAESLQRITGVQISRSRGEGSGVAIRGLGGEFARTQYNGRTVGTGGSRSFDFTALSALFVSAVEVQKSPTADMIEGGLAGTVNVTTARPLSVGKTQLVGSAEAVYEDNAKKTRPRLALLGNYVNAAGTFGANFGVGFEERPLLQYTRQAYGSETSRESSLVVNGVTTAAGKSPPLDYNVDGDFNDTYSFEHGISFQAWPGTRRRLTFVGGVQFKPSDSVQIYADGFSSDFKDRTLRYEVNNRFTNIAPGQPGAPYGIVASTIDSSLKPVAGSQGFLTSLDANGVDRRIDTRDEQTRRKVRTGALGFKVDDGRMHVAGEASYSTANTYTLNPGFSVLSRASEKLTYPDGLGGGGQIGFVRGYDPINPANYYLISQDTLQFRNRDENWEARLDFTRDFDGFLKAVKGGIYWANRHNTSDFAFSQATATQIAAASGGKFTTTANVEGTSGINGSQLLVPLASWNSRVSGFPNGQFLAVDVAKLYAAAPFDTLLKVAPLAIQGGQSLDVNEKTMAAYLRADFGSADDRLGGNIGVRYVTTGTDSIGLSPNFDQIVVDPGGVFTQVPTGQPTHFKGQYAYFLSSFNAKYELSSRLLLRGALARVLGRPGLGSLSGGTSVNANTRQISSGNPGLKPYLSDQADLSLEYYLPHEGLLSAAVFYKHLTNYIINGQTTEVRTITVQGVGPRPTQFTRSQPLNIASTNVKGIEVAAQIPLSYLAGGLDGLGIFGNFTYVDPPSVEQVRGGPKLPLPGISKYNYAAGAYFEKYGFGIRGSYVYRSSFNNGGGYFGDGASQRAYGQLDGSVSYQVTPAISLTADVTNILDAHERYENGIGLLTQDFQIGRRFTGGVRVRF